MARSIEERRAELQGKVKKCEARKAEYEARAEKYRLAGKIEKCNAAAETARKAALYVKSHGRALDELLEEERLQHRARREQDRTRAALDAQHAKVREQVDRLQVYREALRHAAELDTEVERYRIKAEGYGRAGDREKQERAQQIVAQRQQWARDWRGAAETERLAAEGEGRDLERETAIAIKAEERREKKDRTAAQRLEDLKLENHQGTAAAQREIEAGGTRGKRIAILASYAALLRRPEDRIPDRLAAMAEFDDIVGSADAGLFPEPRFEHESGSGKGAGERVMAARAAGLQDLADLESALGHGAVRLLRLRIVERSTFTGIVRQGIGTEPTIAAMFLAAVDQLRVFLATRDALEARLAAQASIALSKASARS